MREVHAIADNGVLHAPRRANVARHDFAGADTHTDADCLLAGRCPPDVELSQSLHHLYCDGNRVIGVAAVRQDRSEHRHDAITDVFVEHAVVSEHDIDHIGEILV